MYNVYIEKKKKKVKFYLNLFCLVRVGMEVCPGTESADFFSNQIRV